VKFLLDQNISFKVAPLLVEPFQNVSHIKQLNLVDASDLQIWTYAKTNNYSIITFDGDFIELSNLKGFPPKIIWLRFGNSSNLKIVNKLISKSIQIMEFVVNAELAFLEID
jgi:predicted nuclease of predicted toxin-antitoxin system